jgi:hypothetical protein
MAVAFCLPQSQSVFHAPKQRMSGTAHGACGFKTFLLYTSAVIGIRSMIGWKSILEAPSTKPRTHYLWHRLHRDRKSSYALPLHLPASSGKSANAQPVHDTPQSLRKPMPACRNTAAWMVYRYRHWTVSSALYRTGTSRSGLRSSLVSCWVARARLPRNSPFTLPFPVMFGAKRAPAREILSQGQCVFI